MWCEYELYIKYSSIYIFFIFSIRVSKTTEVKVDFIKRCMNTMSMCRFCRIPHRLSANQLNRTPLTYYSCDGVGFMYTYILYGIVGVWARFL